METTMESAVGILAVVVIMAVAVVLAGWLHRRKVAALTAWAQQWGWRYTETRPDLTRRFSGSPFGYGRRRRVQHVLTGAYRGHQVLAFEYTYTTTRRTGRKRSSSTHTHQVVALPLPAARPRLEVSREHFGHKLLGLVGVHDLQLPNERFNAAFRIRTDNARFAHDVLHPHMMEWILADGRAHHLAFRFDGDHLLTWRGGSLNPDDALRAADYLADLLERVPAPVWGWAPRS